MPHHASCTQWFHILFYCIGIWYTSIEPHHTVDDVQTLQTKHRRGRISFVSPFHTRKKGCNFLTIPNVDRTGAPNSGRRMTSPSSAPSSSADAHSRRRVFFHHCCASKCRVRWVERVRCPSLLFRPVQFDFLLCKWLSSSTSAQSRIVIRIKFFFGCFGRTPSGLRVCNASFLYINCIVFFCCQRRWMDKWWWTRWE